MLDTEKIKNEVNALMDDTRKWHAKRENSNLDREGFTNVMKEKYNYLYSNSSTLFERCIQGDLNLQHLDYILSMLNRVNAGADYQATRIGRAHV